MWIQLTALLWILNELLCGIILIYQLKEKSYYSGSRRYNSVVSGWLLRLVTKDLVQAQARQCQACGGQNGTKIGFVHKIPFCLANSLNAGAV